MATVPSSILTFYGVLKAGLGLGPGDVSHSRRVQGFKVVLRCSKSFQVMSRLINRVALLFHYAASLFQPGCGENLRRSLLQTTFPQSAI